MEGAERQRVFGYKVVFPGHKLCSTLKYLGLPCAMAVQHPRVPGGPPAAQHPWVPVGDTMQEAGGVPLSS